MMTGRAGTNRDEDRCELITEILPNDILLGRGALAIGNEGNVRFRALVATRKEDYAATTRRSRKDQIARELLGQVRSRNARFLRRMESVEGISAWVEASEKTVLQKVKQSLRDKDPEEKKVRSSPTSSGSSSGLGSETRKRRAQSAIAANRRYPPKKRRMAGGRSRSDSHSSDRVEETNDSGSKPDRLSHPGVVGSQFQRRTNTAMQSNPLLRGAPDSKEDPSQQRSPQEIMGELLQFQLRRNEVLQTAGLQTSSVGQGQMAALFQQQRQASALHQAQLINRNSQNSLLRHGVDSNSLLVAQLLRQHHEQRHQQLQADQEQLPPSSSELEAYLQEQAHIRSLQEQQRASQLRQLASLREQTAGSTSDFSVLNLLRSSDRRMSDRGLASALGAGASLQDTQHALALLQQQHVQEQQQRRSTNDLSEPTSSAAIGTLHRTTAAAPNLASVLQQNPLLTPQVLSLLEDRKPEARPNNNNVSKPPSPSVTSKRK